MKTALVAVPATLALLATVSGCERALHVVSSAQNQAPEVRLSPPERRSPAPPTSCTRSHGRASITTAASTTTSSP